MTDAAPPLRVVAVRARRPWAPPGSLIAIDVTIATRQAVRARLEVTILDLDRSVATGTANVRLRPGRSVRTLRLVLPDVARHGYGLRAVVRRVVGGPRSVAHGAVEALDGWWQSPRHAAITRFARPRETAAAVRALRDWHVTVVQLYDWMYRHYRYEPPAGRTFSDTLGRRVSLDAVQAGVAAGHRVGIASLAYGSVYGAEREYVDRYPDERVFDAEGRPLSLGETFYITDLRPGGPWRRRLMREYARTIRRQRVDGIHMDTYGPPHHAFSADGEAIDFAALYPGLIAEGAATVAAVAPTARVLFNCVEGFPLDVVAAAPAAAVYLELWPPDVRYADIVRWIGRARASGEGRAVVIAAYISSLRTFEHEVDDRTGAVEAAVVLTCVIAAAGAYHHVLAERDRLLVEGYYPEARALRRAERAELQAAWVFTARYVHLLSDPALEPVDLDGLILRDAQGAAIPISSTPTAGAVWVQGHATPDGTTVIQLVDLLDQVDDRWDAVRQPSPTRRGWTLAAHVNGVGRTGVVLSPWTARGAARVRRGDDLPAFRRWLVVVAPALFHA